MLFDHIAELCQALGTTPPTPNERGEYLFHFDGGHDVTCFERNGQIFLTSPLCPMPATEDEATQRCRTLLHVSLGMMKDSPATLSASPDNSTVLVHQRYVPGPHNRQRFSEAMEMFLNKLEAFKLHVATAQEQVAPRQFMMMRP